MSEASLSLPAAERPRHYIREWRKHRRMTQEQLAEGADLSVAAISQIETYKQGFTDETLYALARSLGCSAADLLARDPADGRSEAMQAFDRLDPQARRRALRVLKALADEDAP